MTTLIIILLLIAAYLFGSIPGGYLLTKLVKKEDIRNYGSKSTGATNTTRVLGWKLGALAAFIDIIKGIIVIAILSIFKLEDFYIINNINILPLFGLASVIGHIYPIFLKFKGGKAVATSLGVVTFFTWPIGLLGVLYFIIFVSLTKIVSLTSMIATTLLFLTSLIWYFIDSSYVTLELLITYLTFNILIIIRHIPNIKRMIKGEEPKASFRKQIED